MRLLGSLLFCLIVSSFLFPGCQTKMDEAPVIVQPSFPDTVTFHSGDLIVRHGKGFISDAFRQFSLKDPQYSHAGFISVEDSLVYVYHVIGGEENPSARLRKDLLTDFCNSGCASSFGLFRYTLTDEELTKIDSLVKNYHLAGLEFDTKLDLQTDDKMYCSEFVYKILKMAITNKNIITLSTVSGKSYVAIDNLYLNAYCNVIYKYSYNPERP